MIETLQALMGSTPANVPPLIHYSLVFIFVLLILGMVIMATTLAFKTTVDFMAPYIKKHLESRENQEKNRNKVQPWGKRTVFIKMYDNDIRVARVHYGQSGVYTYWSESELPTTIVMLLPKGRVSGSMVNDWGPHSGWPQEDIQKYYIGE